MQLGLSRSGIVVRLITHQLPLVLCVIEHRHEIQTVFEVVIQTPVISKNSSDHVLITN